MVYAHGPNTLDLMIAATDDGEGHVFNLATRHPAPPVHKVQIN